MMEAKSARVRVVCVAESLHRLHFCPLGHLYMDLLRTGAGEGRG